MERKESIVSKTLSKCDSALFNENECHDEIFDCLAEMKESESKMRKAKKERQKYVKAILLSLVGYSDVKIRKKLNLSVEQFNEIVNQLTGG